MIDIRLLEQLIAFKDCGTLSKASEKLLTSQPALTRSMKKLEDDLGVTLFIRSKNHISLNETGERAAEYARHVLEADLDFEQKVRAFDRSLHTISIGYCAPVPQTVLTPIINNVFDGMTISSDMMDDSQFEEKLLNGTYQLAVTHYMPDDPLLYSRKCGHEELYISLKPEHPLASHDMVELKELDGLTILLLSRIGFWSAVHRVKTPNSRYLLQVESSYLSEIASNSDYPVFSSDYYLRRGESIPGRIHIPLKDPECRTDFYLVCLSSDRGKYRKLFDYITEKTIY